MSYGLRDVSDGEIKGPRSLVAAEDTQLSLVGCEDDGNDCCFWVLLGNIVLPRVR